MNKRGVLFFVILLIVAAITTVAIVSCNKVKTPKMYVYNLLTTKDQEVVIKARETEANYSQIIADHLVHNSDGLINVNNLAKMTTNVIEELTSYVLFVRNTEISAENLEKAYEEYLSAKQYADAKLSEALQTSNSAVWEDITEVLIERYSAQLVKYNKFANELYNYTTQACFANTPKTVKYTTLSFIHGFNSYMVDVYVGENKQSNAIPGTTEVKDIYNKYIKLKSAAIELNTANRTQAMNFIEGFYTFKDMYKLYDAYSRGKGNFELFATDNTNYAASELEEQVNAKQAIYAFITLSSYDS